MPILLLILVIIIILFSIYYFFKKYPTLLQKFIKISLKILACLSIVGLIIYLFKDLKKKFFSVLADTDDSKDVTEEEPIKLEPDIYIHNRQQIQEIIYYISKAKQKLQALKDYSIFVHPAPIIYNENILNELKRLGEDHLTYLQTQLSELLAKLKKDKFDITDLRPNDEEQRKKEFEEKFRDPEELYPDGWRYGPELYSEPLHEFFEKKPALIPKKDDNNNDETKVQKFILKFVEKFKTPINTFISVRDFFYWFPDEELNIKKKKSSENNSNNNNNQKKIIIENDDPLKKPNFQNENLVFNLNHTYRKFERPLWHNIQKAKPKNLFFSRKKIIEVRLTPNFNFVTIPQNFRPINSYPLKLKQPLLKLVVQAQKKPSLILPPGQNPISINFRPFSPLLGQVLIQAKKPILEDKYIINLEELKEDLRYTIQAVSLFNEYAASYRAEIREIPIYLPKTYAKKERHMEFYFEQRLAKSRKEGLPDDYYELNRKIYPSTTYNTRGYHFYDANFIRLFGEMSEFISNFQFFQRFMAEMEFTETDKTRVESDFGSIHSYITNFKEKKLTSYNREDLYASLVLPYRVNFLLFEILEHIEVDKKDPLYERVKDLKMNARKLHCRSHSFAKSLKYIYEKEKEFDKVHLDSYRSQDQNGKHEIDNPEDFVKVKERRLAKR